MVAMSDELVDALDQVVIGSVAITARALLDAGADVTVLQWRALLVIGGAEHISVSGLAQRIGANLSPTSRLVSRLVSRGLARVAKDPADRRTTVVSLTIDGRRLRDAVIEQRRSYIRSAIATRMLSNGDLGAIRRLGRALGGFA